MARIVFGALASEIRGSIGGTTFQRNAYGFTAKNKSNMVRPNTVLQDRGKLYLSRATKYWNFLSEGRRTEWNAWAAANPQYAYNNPSSMLSGHAVYVRRAVYQLMLSFGISDLTWGPGAVSNIDVPTSMSLVTDGTELLFDITWQIGTESFVCLYSISNVASDSKKFVGSSLRFIEAQTTTDGSMSFALAYVNMFGKLPAVATRVNLSYILVGVANGQVTAPVNTLLTIGELP
jgi:hypothetical protein